MPTVIKRTRIIKNYKDLPLPPATADNPNPQPGVDQEYDAGEAEHANGVNEPIETSLGQLTHHPAGKIPPKWEQLDTATHADIFPIDGLGRLPEGQVWCIKTKP